MGVGEVLQASTWGVPVRRHSTMHRTDNNATAFDA